MSGGGSKVAGGILFSLGAIIILASAGIVGMAVNDESQNKDSGVGLGLGEDQEESDSNINTVYAGAAGMGVGFLVMLGAAIALAVGISQRSNEVKGEWVEARDLRNEWAAKTGAVLADLDAEPEGEEAGEPVATPLGKPAIIGIAAVALLLLVGVIAVGASISTGGGVLGIGGDEGDEGPQSVAAYLGNQTLDRSVPECISINDMANCVESTSHQFTPVEGARSLNVTLDFTPGQGGLQEIEFSVQYNLGEGWVEIKEIVTGPGGIILVSATDLPAGHTVESVDLRFRAFPPGNGGTVGQDYTVTVHSYSSDVPQ